MSKRPATPACAMVDDGEYVAAALFVSGYACSVCDDELNVYPAMFIYRPSLRIYDPVCRECGITIMRAAQVRITDPEYK